jgi:hypothetical protein
MGKEQHSLAGEEGGPSSDDRTESLALCILAVLGAIFFLIKGPLSRKVYYGGGPRQLIKTGIKPYLSHVLRFSIRHD